MKLLLYSLAILALLVTACHTTNTCTLEDLFGWSDAPKKSHVTKVVNPTTPTPAPVPTLIITPPTPFPSPEATPPNRVEVTEWVRETPSPTPPKLEPLTPKGTRILLTLASIVGLLALLLLLKPKDDHADDY